MASKITTLFEDSAKTNALYPRTKQNAVSDADGNPLTEVGFYTADTVGSGVDAVVLDFPEFTIKGTAVLTVNRGSIEQQNIKYALTADRKIGMIWGIVVVKGDTVSNMVTCEFNFSVAQQPYEKELTGLIQNTNGVSAGATIPQLRIRTNGSVYTQYALTTNQVRFFLPPTILRFSDF